MFIARVNNSSYILGDNAIYNLRQGTDWQKDLFKKFIDCFVNSEISFIDFVKNVGIVDEEVMSEVINVGYVDEDLMTDIVSEHNYPSWLRNKMSYLKNKIRYDATWLKVEEELKDVLPDENIDIVKAVKATFNISSGDFKEIVVPYMEMCFPDAATRRRAIAVAITFACKDVNVEWYKNHDDVKKYESMKMEYAYLDVPSEDDTDYDVRTVGFSIRYEELTDDAFIRV